MSSKNNVNPDHYKLAGRERQGEDELHEQHKHKYAEREAKTQRRRRREGAGGPGSAGSPQTSRKSGVASSSEKAEGVRHPFEPAPSSNPVAGAFGKEPATPPTSAETDVAPEEEIEESEDQ